MRTQETSLIVGPLGAGVSMLPVALLHLLCAAVMSHNFLGCYKYSKFEFSVCDTCVLGCSKVFMEGFFLFRLQTCPAA